MKRTRLVLLLAVFCCLAVWLFAELRQQRVEASRSEDKAAPYVHVVIFYVKKDAPDGEADALVKDAHELLASIPTVRYLRAGRPADSVTPDLGKKDFHAALVIYFDDYDGLKTYLDHKQHLEYVDRHLKHIDVDKLLVFDFVHQKK